jgi:RHS repeat-associated protein
VAYRGLGRAAAIALAIRDFRVDRPVWQAPGSAPGASILEYLGENAAVEQLSGGGREVVSSTIPLRVNNGSGLAPVSLALRGDGEAFVPANPVVPVAISTSAAGGIAFPAGLSVTPVSASVASVPAVVGDQVMFANTARDTDMLAEPRPGGAAVSWQLRSSESPDVEGLSFNLPAGGVLQWSKLLPGGVEVLEEGRPVLLVPPASAQAANGASVPVSYSISGDVLSTHVDLSGEVQFPVLVDPTLFYGYYGAKNGADAWNDWVPGTSYSGFGAEAYEHLLKMGTNPGAPSGTAGWFTVTAPGLVGKPGSAGITRVDLTDVSHQSNAQSRLVTTINESDGPRPDWTYNGVSGEVHPLPLYEPGGLSGQSIAMCASGAGGHDGEEEPLCEENDYQGHSFLFEDEIVGTQSVYNYVSVEGAQITYRDPAAPNKVVLNEAGYSGEWLKTGPANWKIEAEDEGLGIAHFEIQIPAGASPTFSQSVSCDVQNGFEGCPTSYSSEPINLSGVAKTGVLQVAPVATDVAGNVARLEASYGTLYLDQTPPVIGELKGTLGAAAGGVIGDGNYTLSIEPTDGSLESPQSGVKSVEIKVDGNTVATHTSSCGAPKGPPAGSCYGLPVSWTMNGQAFGAGPHTITIIAKDWAGNEATKVFGVTVNEAAYEPLGPGAVNLETGDIKLNPTDVSIGAGNTTLSVSRTYDSRNTTQGTSGPLGPDWLLSLPASASAEEWQSLTPQPEGSVSLTNAHGGQVVFSPKTGGGYNSPAGYQTETLTEPVTSPATYQLTDVDGDYTQFKQPTSSAQFVPVAVVQGSGAGELNKVSYKFTTITKGITKPEYITEPTEILGPEPTPGACTTTLVKGCRALSFTYATSTTASGEAPSQWGEYEGRLATVSFTAWEKVKGEMVTIPVAEYRWDSQGRLRSEWDPRITPNLKTTYGYDPENHITAVNGPDEQPWLLTYGTTTEDNNRGRVISTTRPNALTALYSGAAPNNTASPVLSPTSAKLGVSMSVTTGTWGNSPLSYGYQWEDCNATGGECAVIPGATNKTYTPLITDAEHTIVAQVLATNSDGTTVATTAPSSVVARAENTLTFGSLGNKEGQLEDPSGVAVNTSTGNIYVASTNANRVEEFNSSGKFVAWIGTPGSGNGQLSRPEALAIDSSGNLYVGDSGNSRIAVFNKEGVWSKNLTTQLSSAIGGIAVTPNGDIYATNTTVGDVVELSPSGEQLAKFGNTGQHYTRLNSPTGIAYLESNGNSHVLLVADTGEHEIWEYTSSGSLLRAIGGPLAGEGSLSAPTGIAVNPASDNLYVTDRSADAVKQYNYKTAAYVATLGSAGTGTGQFQAPLGAATTTSSGTSTAYFADSSNNRVEAWTITEPTEPTPAPPSPGTSDVTTIEYHVPLEGTAAPYTMNQFSLKQWGQTDDPVDATAIFPGDEPEGWPAQDYKRASIFYLDSANRTVNTASPTGGLTTTEYGSENDITRTLSADNRELALKASNTAEEARLLSTSNVYNSANTELVESHGPAHVVKLAAGGEVSVRKRTQFFYDEGSPGGASYGLVTKTIEAGETASGEEKEPRTVKTGYSGQNNLGWKLHEPTSVTTSNNGHELTSETKYEVTGGGKNGPEVSTGNVVEALTPAGVRGEAGPTFASQFGSLGSEPGELNEPKAVAVASNGNVLVVDTQNNRVEEYTPSGSYVGKFGEAGAGHGQFNEPDGIAVNAKGEVAITDGKNNRVQVFNSKHEFLLQFGSEGSGAGQFKEVRGIAYAPGSGAIFVTEYGNSRIDKFNEKGEFEEMFGWGVSNGEAKLEVCKTSCRAGLSGGGTGEFDEPRGIGVTPAGNVWVVEVANARLQELTEGGTFVRQIARQGEFSGPKGLTVDAAGDVFVADTVHATVQAFSPSGTHLWTVGMKGAGTGQWEEPTGITITTEGALYVSDIKNNDVQRWALPFLGRAGAHNTQTVYYTAAENPSYPSCGGHPEWAGLACQAQPAAQPEAAGTPNLPVTTYTAYNIWQEPTSITDTAGTTTRTTTISYDAAGRTKTTAISSSIDTPVPAVTDEYSATTGALVKQTNGTQSISSTENTLGQMLTYTDANGNTASYEYEPEHDFRPVKMNDGKGTQTYEYNATTGELEKLKDSAAGTFTATRDIEGNITTEGLPNGMNANYTLNPVGEPTSLEYVKTTHCTSGCVWYTDSVTPSARGQWLTQTSSLSKQTYEYDELEELTGVQDTPAGGDCTARLYSYDEDENRTSQITRASTTSSCPTTGGTTQTFTHDTADRLDEHGVEYEAFGNTTNLPAADAGGSTLTSTFYVNDRTASLTQNGQSISYKLDPASRVSEAIYTGTSKGTLINHYAGPGQSPAWSEEGGVVTREIAGISGGLKAIQTNGGTPVLQLSNLHGDTIATLGLAETEPKLLSTSDTTEFGVPRTSSPPRYNWLGADELPTELSSGVVGMGARTYVPELGRFEQTDPQPGGSGNPYTYTHNDPVNQADPSGEWTNTVSYDYEAAETGASHGLAETYTAPGAILPPPVNAQIEAEFVAHPPWDAATVSSETLGSENVGLDAYADALVKTNLKSGCVALIITIATIRGTCGDDLIKETRRNEQRVSRSYYGRAKSDVEEDPSEEPEIEDPVDPIVEL